MIRAILIALAFALAFPGAIAAQSGAPVTIVTVTDRLMISDSQTKGPPVILIPGLASPGKVWDGIFPDLAKDHRVYVVEVRGFVGDAPRADLGSGILEGVVADLDGFISYNKLEKPAVVGHSMGGLVGMMLAARHPDSVGRLMVVDALPFIGTLFGADDVASIKPRAAQMRDMMAAAPRAQSVTTDPGGIWSNTPEGRIKVANWSTKSDPGFGAQAMHEVMTTDMRPELGKIAARPFTVLYATGAGPRAKAIWERAYAGSPATLVAVPDSWHFIMLDQPARFAAEVKTFLSR